MHIPVHLISFAAVLIFTFTTFIPFFMLFCYSFDTINDLYTQCNHVSLLAPLFLGVFHFITNVSTSDKCKSDHNSIHIQPLTHFLLLFFYSKYFCCTIICTILSCRHTSYSCPIVKCPYMFLFGSDKILCSITLLCTTGKTKYRICSLIIPSTTSKLICSLFQICFYALPFLVSFL